MQSINALLIYWAMFVRRISISSMKAFPKLHSFLKKEPHRTNSGPRISLERINNHTVEFIAPNPLFCD